MRGISGNLPLIARTTALAITLVRRWPRRHRRPGHRPGLGKGHLPLRHCSPLHWRVPLACIQNQSCKPGRYLSTSATGQTLPGRPPHNGSEAAQQSPLSGMVVPIDGRSLARADSDGTCPPEILAADRPRWLLPGHPATSRLPHSPWSRRGYGPPSMAMPLPGRHHRTRRGCPGPRIILPGFVPVTPITDTPGWGQLCYLPDSGTPGRRSGPC